MKQIVTWECHIDEFDIDRYDMILGRDLITARGMVIKFSERVISGVDGTYEGCLAPIVDVRN